MFRDMSAFFASKGRIAGFIGTMVLMCLFRKNGIYIIVCMLFLILLLLKKYRRQCLCLFGSVILLFFVADRGLQWALHATAGSMEEALSVPMQQVARVYNEHAESAFEEEELALIYSSISEAELRSYNPFLSDHIKNYFDYNVVADHQTEYLSLWLQKGLQYPGEYAEAFLDNTYQAWYPGTSIYDGPGEEQTYYFDMNMCAGGERDTKAPGLLKFYENIATGYYYQKLPVIRLFFSVGFMFWAALLVLAFAIDQRNLPLFMAMSMVMLCCATVLLGPISLVRYYLVLFYGFPVSMGFLFDRRKEGC